MMTSLGCFCSFTLYFISLILVIIMKNYFFFLNNIIYNYNKIKTSIDDFEFHMKLYILSVFYFTTLNFFNMFFISGTFSTSLVMK